MNPTIKTLIAATIAILTWGSAFVFIRIGLMGYSPGALALFRFLISSALMGVFYYRLKTRHKPTLNEMIQIFLIGCAGIGLYSVFLNYGEISVSASIASFIIGIGPVVSMMWASVFFKEKISLKGWLGVLVSIIGILIIAMSHPQSGKLDWHILLVLAATLVGSIYNVAQKPLMQKFHPIEVATLSAWSGTLILFIYFPQLIHEIPKATLGITSGVIYLGIFPGMMGYMAWSYVMQSKMPASKLVLSLYTLPLVSTLLGWLILSEMPAIGALLGGCIALLGALIATRY